MGVRPPLGVVPVERIAIFIDGTNFKHATFDAFAMRVDFSRLLEYFSRSAILLRAYYYTGEWDDWAITQFLRLSEPADPVAERQEMERQRDGDRKFWRFLDRNGFRVVRKPVRVLRDAQGDVRVKADLDLELAIDMLTLAERCEKQILISGDGDFVPLVHAVAARGVRVAVVSTQSEEAYRSAHYRASDDLLDAADEFVSIESIRADIERDRPVVSPAQPEGRPEEAPLVAPEEPQPEAAPEEPQPEAAPEEPHLEAPEEPQPGAASEEAPAAGAREQSRPLSNGPTSGRPLVSPAAAAAAARYAAAHPRKSPTEREVPASSTSEEDGASEDGPTG
jgi:uncharacterized LabA/DUF88 family protein